MRLNIEHPRVAQLVAGTQLHRAAFTIRETAAMCGTCYGTIYNAIQRGDLGAIRDTGHRFLIPAIELDRFLRDHTTYNPKPGRRGPRVGPSRKVKVESTKEVAS